jgi:DNA-binding transcriptional MerR regulator
MLTIGQLAAFVGVTVRTVRHYHDRGLLAEPARDASGYRRYGASDAIQLIRIKTLAGAGVPLSRIKELLTADPDQFARAVVEIERAIDAKIRQLRLNRRQIAELMAGERLYMPTEVADYLDRLRGIGLSRRTVEEERDDWILVAAAAPGKARGWVTEKMARLDDPEFRRLYRAYDEALEWDPADERLVELAAALKAYAGREDVTSWDTQSADEKFLPYALALIAPDRSELSPGHQRLMDLLEENVPG